ncbi:Type IV secretory system conjugative DNA transfer family protein [Deinococcus saxicola]|uniref:type IV secretory system conjugative DNA transfer family protein n=1 Tax=Deinococcus saxicola TaxID=249406 RepID=UPI0039EFB0B4
MTGPAPAHIPTRPPAAPLDPVMVVFLGTVAVALSLLLVQAQDVGSRLGALVYDHTGLAASRSISKDAWAALLMACSGDKLCSPWLSVQFKAGMAWSWLILLLPGIATPLAAAFIPRPRKLSLKDPGMAQWETEKALKRFMHGQAGPEDPFVGFMGYLKSGLGGDRFDAWKLPPMFIPVEDYCQNTLVWGGIRSGKTTGFFQPNIMLGAHLPMSCVVFDVKWPQKNSGFFETIGYWHLCGRPVVLLTPFEASGARINLLKNVDSFSDALTCADAVFPPPEFQNEVGKHYNDKKRFMIAALMWLLRTEKGDEATMKDVLDRAMMEDNRLMEWVECCRDEQAKALLRGYREAGDASFAETKNGIISALKVFFNAQVVHATSGGAHETVNLEDCFRTPTLTLIGINQENMIDRSGEILFRLYKSLLDIAAMRVAAEQGGKLRNHLAYFMDEIPTIGKVNYMMGAMGTMRSYNISHHLGFQNDAMGKLVFGDIYWQAMTTNVVARTIVFPRGIGGEDAEKVSKMIGLTSGLDVSVGRSQNTGPQLGGSTTASSKVAQRYLLSYEEFSHFSLGEAVIRMNGQQPIRAQFAPMGMPHVTGTGIRRKVKNVLHPLYASTIARCPRGLIQHTQEIIEKGELTRKNGCTRPMPAPVQSRPVQPGGGHQAVRPIALQPAVPAAGTDTLLPASEAERWLRECMAELVDIEVLKPTGTLSVKINREEKLAVNGEAAVSRLFIGDLVNRNATRMAAQLTPRAQGGLSAAMQAELARYAVIRSALSWWKLNAVYVEGSPEREQHLKDCADAAPPRTPLEARGAMYESPGILLCHKSIAREFCTSTAVNLPTRRIGTRDWAELPIGDHAALAHILMVNVQAPLSADPPATKMSRQQQKAASTQKLRASVIAPAPPGLFHPGPGTDE